MNQTELIKIPAVTAAEVCANFDLDKAGKKLLRDGMTPQEFVTALVDGKRFVDAIEFMAYALPPRDSIWWGCLCMQHAFGENLAEPDRAAAVAAVRWVLAPNEDNRVAAQAPSQAAPPPSVAGSLATAAFHTGGNIAPAGMSFFKAPEPFAPAKAVALAVKLASIKAEPPKIAKVQKSYVQLAMDVAAGRVT